ncbi:MAG: ion transporter [Limisphaerales bacterium]
MNNAAQRLVAAPWFQRTIITFILLAGVLAGLETDAALVAEHGRWLHALDRLVLGVFVLEILLKLAAHAPRPWEYFRDGWNMFDFVIVAVCLLPIHAQFVAAFRVARALRLLRLVSALPKLQLLVGALLKSLSAMGYVSLLLGLLFYIYAVAGVHLFGAGSAEHFGNLGTAMMTLFQIVTLDNWGDILDAQLAHARGVIVAFYFVTFIVFGTMIILNLFIGIIMNSMAEMHEEIAARAAAEQPAPPTVADEARALEAELESLKRRVARLRRRAEQP